MTTTYGLRGQIAPPGALGTFAESFTDGPFQVSVHDGVIEIGFADELLADDARAAVRLYFDASSFARGQHLSWRKNALGGTDYALSLGDTVNVRAELATVTTEVTQQGTAAIIHSFDSRSLAGQQDLVAKARKNPALASALQYFNEEVVGDDRPLYGVYKAIEAITKVLPGGREELGMLAGAANKKAGKKLVDDVMQTAGVIRHHNDPNAKRVLSDAECVERAKRLILAYAQTIT